MARQRDRMEDFKDLVHRRALSLEFEESKIASILASFILHKQWKRSPFTSATLKTLESIDTLAQFMLRHQKDYLDLHRTTEQERDNIEHEVTIFIRSCKEQIDILRNCITEESKSDGWINRQQNSNADTIAHKHGVVLILSEKLHFVTSNFDRLRAVRFQNAINKMKPRKKVDRCAKPIKGSLIQAGFDTDSPGDHLPEDPVLSRQQKQQHLDDETWALQAELSGLMEAARETEAKMIEMSALNHLMSTHVLQQAKQIEQLYEEAVLATSNMDMGNKELSHAIDSNRGSRAFLLLFLSVLTFSLLFLDWYNG